MRGGLVVSIRVRDRASYREWARDALPAGLVFLGPDPHHALGFIDLVPRLAAAAADRPPALAALAAAGLPLWAPADVGPGEGADAGGGGAAEGGRSSADLAATPGFNAWLGSLAVDGVLPPVAVFKPSHRLEQLAAASGWRLLSAPAGLARRWENKVAFRERAAALGLRQPPGMVVDPAMGFAAVAAALGAPFVLQAPHGYSGARTLLVADADAFASACGALRAPRLRATAFVSGRPITLNACVTAAGVVMSGPFAQVTGEAALTRHGLGSCGNDWSWPGLAALDLDAYRRVARTVGEALAAEGFRGIFGLDFVQPAGGGPPWLIEVNPRLVASVSLHAQLELAAGRVPLAARHLLALLDPAADDLPPDLHEGMLSGGQLILHNLSDAARVWEPATTAGAWPGGTDGAVGPAICLLRQLPPDGASCLLLPPPSGRLVASGAEWGRVQCPQGVLDDDGAVKGTLLDGVAGLLAAGGWPTRAEPGNGSDGRTKPILPEGFV